MKGDLKDLKTYLDKKFNKVATKADVDHRFDAVDKRFDEVATKAEVKEGFADVDHRFDVVATEVVNLRTEMEHGFVDLKKDFRELQSAVSTYATRADTYFQEMVMLTQRVRRLEQWVEDLAAKAGVKLKS